MKTTNKILICAFFVLCFLQGLAAAQINPSVKGPRTPQKPVKAVFDKISVNTKSGDKADIEVIGIVGDSLRYKKESGSIARSPLESYDEESLIRIIKELGKRIEANSVAASPPSKSSPLNGDGPAGDNLPGKLITLSHFEAVPERYRDEKVKVINVSYEGINKLGTGILEDELRFEYFCFYGRDKNGGFSGNFLYRKSDLETVVAMKRNQKINVAGHVIFNDHRKYYYFVVEKIEVVK